MATLTVQDIVEAGLTPSLSAAAGGGDQFILDSAQRVFFWADNASGGAITVTIAAQITAKEVAGFGSMTRDDLAVSVGAGVQKLIGPIANAFTDTSGFAQVTYSGVTSLTVAAVKLPPIQ